MKSKEKASSTFCILCGAPIEGKFSATDLSLIQSSRVVCADSGADAARLLGLNPEVVIGDLDSISKAAQEYFLARGIPFEAYPTNKDLSDLELAMAYAEKKGAKSVKLIGIYGGRADYTYSNMLTIASEKFSDLSISILDPLFNGYLLRAGQTMDASCNIDEVVSIIPLSIPSCTMSLSGTKWDLNNEVITFGSSRTMSNRCKKTNVTCSVHHGKALFIHLR